MQPVRKVISATHFRPVEGTKWTPCSPGHPEGVEKSWDSLSSDELVEPPLGMADFVKSVDQVRPTVSPADILKHDEWTKESGADGM